MTLPIMFLFMMVGCIGALFMPFATLVIGIFGIFFVDAYAPTNENNKFSQILPKAMSLVVIFASFTSLVFRFVS